MNLKKYDGKCVKITDIVGDVFEGICYYNDKEYNMHEFNRNEESLQITYYMFYKSNIEKIESLENHKGPYGKFEKSFSKLEEMIIEDGIDYINDVLFDDENEHIYRLIVYIDKYFDSNFDKDLNFSNEIIKSLKKLLELNNDEKIQKETKRILEKWSN